MSVDLAGGRMIKESDHNITQGTLALPGNYTLSYVGNTLSIPARGVEVSADHQAKTYGDADPALTYKVTKGTLVGNDAFTGALARDPGENVGDHNITQGTLALPGNYTLSYVGNTLSITAQIGRASCRERAKISVDAD